MTCITAAVKGGKCAIAADSFGGSASSYQIYKTPKLVRKPVRNGGGSIDVLIGYTSSYRMGDILRYLWECPEFSGDANEWIVAKCIPSLRCLFESEGFMGKDDSRDSGGDFIFIVDCRIFHIQNDFSVLEPSEGYLSVGSGEYIAVGAMWNEAAREEATAESICSAGMRAAIAHNPYVAGPVIIERCND